MQQLYIEDCPKLRHQLTQHIGKYCKHLENLTLSELQYLDDSDIDILIENCPSIRNINLSYTGISNNTIQAALQGWPKLRILNYCGCKNVTFIGIELIFHQLIKPQLFSGNPQLELISLQSINTAWPYFMVFFTDKDP